MKKMKMYLMTAILGVASLSMVFTSCNTDECKDVVCQNGGLCQDSDGSCECPVGFEGTNCETYSKVKFLGDYKGDGIDTDNDTYTGWTIRIIDADATSTTAVNVALLDDNNAQQESFTGSMSATGVLTLDDKTAATYTTDLGSGTVTEGVSMNLTVRYNPLAGSPYTITFSNMVKQ